MNSNAGIEEDSYKQLLILEELSKNGEVTQRDVSRNLGIALGLVNSYMKNLTSKGYITIASIPKKRFKYYLTPKGFREMSSLTYRHLHNFTNLYKVARRDFRSLFQKLQDDGVKRLAFCGVDEVAEIAYLTLQEFDLELAGVVDNAKKGEFFFGLRVSSLPEMKDLLFDNVVITGQMCGSELYAALLDEGIASEKIVVNGIL